MGPGFKELGLRGGGTGLRVTQGHSRAKIQQEYPCTSLFFSCGTKGKTCAQRPLLSPACQKSYYPFPAPGKAPLLQPHPGLGTVSPAHTGSCSRGEFPVSGSGAGCGFPAPGTLWHISTCWPENPRVGEAESHGRGAWGGDPTGMEPWTPILYPQCRFPGLWEWDLGSHWDGNGIPVS